MDKKALKKALAGLSEDDKQSLIEELGIKSPSSDKDILDTLASIQSRLDLLENPGEVKKSEVKMEEPKKEKTGLAGLFDIF